MRAAGLWSKNGIPTDTVAVLDESRDSIPVGGTVSADVTGDLAKMNFEWETIGSGDLLMLALPHHMDTMETQYNPGKTRSGSTIQTILEVDVLKGNSNEN